MIILLTSMLILSFIGYYLYYFTEESQLLTLRAYLVVLVALSAILVGLAFIGIDDNFHREYLFLNNSTIATISPDIYYIASGVMSLLVFGLYLQKSTWTNLIIVLSLSLVLARFVNYYLPEQTFAAALYCISAYYLFLLLTNLFQKPLERIPASLAAIFTPIPLVLFADSWRYHQYYATYLALIFIGGIWIRYFWVLEYKRREKCSHCDGWGKKTAKFNDIFAWAAGYKRRTQTFDYALELKQNIMHLLGYKNYQALPTTCLHCKGKGWNYRANYNENILFTPDDGYNNEATDAEKNKDLQPKSN